MKSPHLQPQEHPIVDETSNSAVESADENDDPMTADAAALCLKTNVNCELPCVSADDGEPASQKPLSQNKQPKAMWCAAGDVTAQRRAKHNKWHSSDTEQESALPEPVAHSSTHPTRTPPGRPGFYVSGGFVTADDHMFHGQLTSVSQQLYFCCLLLQSLRQI